MKFSIDFDKKAPESLSPFIREVGLFHKAKNVTVLNQWTYHSRLYNSATLATKNKDMQVVQLVSFGCGIDAITTDEVREILESKGKFYTQLKIDDFLHFVYKCNSQKYTYIHQLCKHSA